MDTSTRTHKQGFTLIELLVVIAIVAILASILFPVFARARENARRSSCMSNLKQIGLGIIQYTQDYDEYYPPTWYGRQTNGTYGSFTQNQAGTPGRHFTVCDGGSCNNGGAGNWITWMDVIYPYVKNVQLFVCPSSFDPEKNGGPIPDYQYSGAFGNTAGETMASTDTDDFGVYRYGLRITGTSTPVAAVVHPARAVMVVEASGSRSQYISSGSPRFWQVYSASEPQNFRPHLEGSNIAYGDGHVKWMSLTSMQAAIGSNTAQGNTSCNLGNVNSTLPYCSPLWNPFLP